jgi:hypothetical protein
MKILLLALSLNASAVFADNVLLKCHDSAYSDLKNITLVEGEAGKMIVTEVSEDGSTRQSQRDVKDLSETQEIQLSSWNDYVRTLYFDGISWSIEHRDTCSSGITSVICE